TFRAQQSQERRCARIWQASVSCSRMAITLSAPSVSSLDSSPSSSTLPQPSVTSSPSAPKSGNWIRS
ncbi:hypothetical protein BGZ90_000844, partial [Linnemannia elongata]